MTAAVPATWMWSPTRTAREYPTVGAYGESAGTTFRSMAPVSRSRQGLRRPSAGRVPVVSIVDGADAMADPVGVQLLERPAHRLGADDLPGMRHRRQPRFLRRAEGRLERLRRVEVLLASQADADDPALLVLDRVADGLARRVERRPARDIRRQPHLDVMPLARLGGAVAVAGKDLVPIDPAPHSLDRREDALDVDRAVGARLCRVVDDNLAKVVVMAEGVRRQRPDVHEVIEVAVAGELHELRHRCRREPVAVAAGGLGRRLPAPPCPPVGG